MFPTWLQGAVALRLRSMRFARPSDLFELTQYPPFATLRPAAHEAKGRRQMKVSTIMLAVLMLGSVPPVHAQDASKPDPAAVEKYATFDVQPGGACNLDQVSVDGDEVTLSGWAILSRDSDSAPPNPVLLQLDVDGSSRRVIADRTEREDVAVDSKNDALKMSGFTAMVKRQAGMVVTVLQPFAGHLLQCPDKFPAS
jgi:hypothetical protein